MSMLGARVMRDRREADPNIWTLKPRIFLAGAPARRIGKRKYKEEADIIYAWYRDFPVELVPRTNIIRDKGKDTK